MSKLLVCPCGKIPTLLHLCDNGQGSKWAVAAGNCCGEWSVEFRTHYSDFHSKECIALAAEAWNEAPRGI